MTKQDGCTFVTDDFKDLYTNILFKDTSNTLKELAIILGIEKVEVDFLLDLYLFCNNCNYFNVGNNLYKQVKAVSMGRYFSKDVSDLVLLYSGDKYFLVRNASKEIFLKRYADDEIILFSVRDSTSILSELRKIMLFYPSNLGINIVKNCDLSIFRFSVLLDIFLNHKSNHPKHVFKGLVRTQCMCYIRNSLCEDDYMLSLQLFIQRLLRAGYTKGFIHRNVISYKEGLQCMEFKRTKKTLGGLFVYPLMYDKVDSVSTFVERILMKAKGGLPLPITFFIPKRVDN